MKWASGISVESDLEAALTEIKRDLARQLGDGPDLLLVFVTPHFQDLARQLPGLVAGRLSPGLPRGCTATVICPISTPGPRTGTTHSASPCRAICTSTPSLPRAVVPSAAR